MFYYITENTLIQLDIAINIIATNRYIEFVQPLVDSLDKYFLNNHKLTVNLFTNDLGKVNGTERVSIREYEIEPYTFPEATLLRFHIMDKIKYNFDYVYYLDADMLINDFVGDEILGDLVAVRHPGYFIDKNSGSWETNPKSACFVPIKYRTKYFAGGFQGGKNYIKAVKEMKSIIDEDRANDIVPIWHDESAWNRYLIHRDYLELTPTYCMPQAWSKRVYSRIHNLPAKILALEKDLNYIRA